MGNDTTDKNAEILFARDIFIVLVIMLVAGVRWGFDLAVIPAMGSAFLIFDLFLRLECAKMIRKKKRCQICN